MVKGRGAQSNVKHRFQITSSEPDSEYFDDELSCVTEVRLENATRIITKNSSPDIPFNQSINPYRGCEHGCAYCYARASHAYLELSPGLDFETILYAKQNANELLIKEISQKTYQCQTIAFGNNTDAYQPIERKLKLTRSLLETLTTAKHPLSIVTKSALILRDLDLLTQLAKDNLIHVAISITSLDHALARQMEPRAASPSRRLMVIEQLVKVGVPVSVLMAPIIPSINDHEIEDILASAKSVGALNVNYVILRLPHEVKQVFLDWLQINFPLRYKKVVNRLQDIFGEDMYQSEFGTRMRGTGEFAELINARFKLALKQNGYENNFFELAVDKFSPHKLSKSQMNLFE